MDKLWISCEESHLSYDNRGGGVAVSPTLERLSQSQGGVALPSDLALSGRACILELSCEIF